MTHCSTLLFFLLKRPPQSTTLFPYTTLFRSRFRLWPPRAVPRADRGSRSRRRARVLPHRRRARVGGGVAPGRGRSEEHTSELQSHVNLVCRLLLEKKKILSSR